MKKPPKSARPAVDPASKDAVKYRAAREVIEKVENRIAEEEEDEEIQKPGRMMFRIMIGAILIGWIVVMIWISVKTLKKKDHAAQPRSQFAALVELFAEDGIFVSEWPDSTIIG